MPANRVRRVGRPPIAHRFIGGYRFAPTYPAREQGPRDGTYAANATLCGATIVSMALEKGMKADGVVFMGSALDKDHDMKKALENTVIKSFWSSRDWAAWRVDGAGSYGFTNPQKGLTEQQDNRFTHLSSKGNEAKHGFPDEGRVGWVSYISGYTHIADEVQIEEEESTTMSNGMKINQQPVKPGFQVLLSDGWKLQD